MNISCSMRNDFKQATKALFHELRYENFSKNDIHDYMRSAMESDMTEALTSGKDGLMSTKSQQISSLVTPSVLDEFKRATQALWRDIRFEGDQFSPVEILTFMSRKMGSFTREADLAGPITLENSPMVRAAIKYVKNRAGWAQREVAEQVAIHLYDLDAEAVRVMRRELDTEAQKAIRYRITGKTSSNVVDFSMGEDRVYIFFEYITPGDDVPSQTHLMRGAGLDTIKRVAKAIQRYVDGLTLAHSDSYDHALAVCSRLVATLGPGETDEHN